MADAITPLAAMLEEFDSVRGVREDGQWAFQLPSTLLMRGAEPDVVTAALGEALDLVRNTRESPEGLYGTPAVRADELQREWLDEGRTVLAQEPSVAWREVPSYGLAATGCIAILSIGLMLANGETTTRWSLGVAILSLTVGMGSIAAIAAWESLLRRRSEITATAVAVWLVMMVSTLAATAFFFARDHQVGTVDTWWLLVPAAACLAIATLWHRRVDRAPLRGTARPANDDEWGARLTAALRVSAKLSEARVRTILAEARAHASESGVSLTEEFGTPENYAARFSPDLARRSRLQAGLLAVLAALTAIFQLDEWSWRRAMIAVLLAWLAVREVRRARALQRDSLTQSLSAE